MAYGVEDDTFLHLVDAWAESKMSGRVSSAHIDAACREMRELVTEVLAMWRAFDS